jgi:putative tricarboxylic transport membrane protein
VSEQHTGRTAGPRAPRFGRAEQEILTAVVLLLGSLYLRLNMGDFITGRRGAGYVDPDFWPGWLLNVIIVSSAAYALQAWRKRSSGSDPSDVASVAERLAPQDTDSEGLHKVAVSGSLLRLVLGFGLLWGYIYAMTRIGFVPSTFVFSLLFLRFVGERRAIVLIAIPVTIVVAILGVFTRLLVVPLPRGSGFFLEISTYFY